MIERWIAASPETVFGFLTDPAKWRVWQGTEVSLDPRPGGVHRVNVRGDGFAAGEYVEVVAARRVSFTWGFEQPGHPLGPGASLVVIDLEPEGGGTRLRLTQSDVPPAIEGPVRHGWEHYLDRLVLAAAGRDPGPDPNLGRPKVS